MKLLGVTACVFDAYGTLFDLDSVMAGARDTLGDKAAPLAELWRRKQLEYSWLRSLMGRHTEFWHVTGESLDYAMTALGLADPALRARLMETYLAPRAYPDVLPLLTKLRDTELKLAILSNGSPTMLTSATKSAGLSDLFDKVISVEEVGIYKPHPSVYRLAVERLECQAPQIAFVSANGWDVAGAAAFGFQTVWCNRRKALREQLPAIAHAEIAGLSELPGLLSP